MIAAKSAKMKCVIVPALDNYRNPAWEAADLKIDSLSNFNDSLLKSL